MNSTRDQIIDTVCNLLETQGYHATGLNQIVKESGAPKGSLYHYFPGGKEELTAEAITRNGHTITERVKANLDSSAAPGEAIKQFLHTIAFHIEASEYCTGGPLTTVAMETAVSSPRINQACRDAYIGLQTTFASKLVSGGFTPERAGQLANFIVAAIEGGIILSRTHHSGDPLRQVGDELGRMLDADC